MSNVNLDAAGDMNIGGDVVGRDKIIHNIVIVGQILDFALIEGLIPRPAEQEDFESVASAFSTVFREHLNSELLTATAMAGDLLRPIFAQFQPQATSHALPYKKVLPSLAEPLLSGLIELGYWDSYSQPLMDAQISIQFSTTRARKSEFDSWNASVIWLDSLRELWIKRFKQDKLYGIAGFGKTARWLVKGEHEAFEQANFSDMSSSEFRVFITGLVIDFIRIASAASTDRELWRNIVDVLTPPTAS